jgi:hypothetical protein
MDGQPAFANAPPMYGVDGAGHQGIQRVLALHIILADNMVQPGMIEDLEVGLIQIDPALSLQAAKIQAQPISMLPKEKHDMAPLGIPFLKLHNAAHLCRDEGSVRRTGDPPMAVILKAQRKSRRQLPGFRFGQASQFPEQAPGSNPAARSYVFQRMIMGSQEKVSFCDQEYRYQNMKIRVSVERSAGLCRPRHRAGVAAMSGKGALWTAAAINKRAGNAGGGLSLTHVVQGF